MDRKYSEKNVFVLNIHKNLCLIIIPQRFYLYIERYIDIDRYRLAVTQNLHYVDKYTQSRDI